MTAENIQYGVLTILALFITKFLFKHLFLGPRRSPSRKAWAGNHENPHNGSGVVMPCQNPRTGQKIGEVRAFTPDEVKQAYRRSKDAQKDWQHTSFTERRALLQDILDWIVDNQEELQALSIRECGKTRTEAAAGEIMATVEKLRWIIAHGEKHLSPEGRPVPTLLAFTKKAYTEWYPLGVIGVIVPWNYPFQNIISHVVTALFCGNGCLLKTSEITPFCASTIENELRRMIARRGHNPDLVQVVVGYGETGASLVQSGVEKVLFIGSPQVGKLVMRGASATLTPVILELGGKDPFIVFDDANYNHMLDIALRGAFFSCGQNCVSSERFYIQAGIYDKFVADIGSRVKQLRVAQQGDTEASMLTCEGNTYDYGSMTMPQQVDMVDGMIQEAVASGARLITGGVRKYAKGESQNDSLVYLPTVLADVQQDMKIASTEVFGPCMTIIKFQDEHDLLPMVNSTPFGLGSSVFTTDYTKANRVGKQIRSGMLVINDFAMVPMVGSLPFGGVGESGFGCFNGPEGLRGMCQQKSIVTDRLPFQMDAPYFLTYPVSQNSDRLVNEGVRMVYGRSWFASVAAFGRFLILIFSDKKTNFLKRE